MARIAARRVIRVLVNGAGWLTESVGDLLDRQPDMQLVKQRALSIVGAKARPAADVIVVPLKPSGHRRREALFARSGVPLVAVSKDFSRVEIYTHWAVRAPPEGLGLDNVADAIRQATRLDSSVTHSRQE